MRALLYRQSPEYYFFGLFICELQKSLCELDFNTLRLASPSSSEDHYE